MGTPECEHAIKPGEWNDLEIQEEGVHYVTRLNGVPCVDFTDPQPNFTEGVIGLQLHTGGGVRVRYKDIYLKNIGVKVKG
jgi:putative component of toxin-antitoxin plasmid stabilization module